MSAGNDALSAGQQPGARIGGIHDRDGSPRDLMDKPGAFARGGIEKAFTEHGSSLVSELRVCNSLTSGERLSHGGRIRDDGRLRSPVSTCTGTALAGVYQPRTGSV